MNEQNTVNSNEPFYLALNLFNDHKEYKDSNENKKAEKGDRLIISYKGFLEGKPFEGGSAEKQVIDLGKNNYFPEFDKNFLLIIVVLFIIIASYLLINLI